MSAEVLECVAQVDDVELHYLAAGEGDQTVVFLHGAGGVLRSAAFIPMLAERFRLLVPSRPGFDRSTLGHCQTHAEVTDVLAEWLAKVADGPVNVVAESTGSVSGCWLAVRYPNLVQRLVLVAPAAFHVASGPPPPTEDRDRLLFGEHPDWASPPTDEEMLQRQRNSALNGQKWRSPDGNRALLERLGDIRAETLVLFGTNDQLIPPEQGLLYQERIPRTYRFYLYGAAHSLSVAAARPFVDLVTDFLKRGDAFIVNTGAA
jgi:pimeloyl-ACP methyl ester carboxylesterase